MRRNADESFEPLKDCIRMEPEDKVQPPEPLLSRAAVFKKFFKYDVMPLEDNKEEKSENQ